MKLKSSWWVIALLAITQTSYAQFNQDAFRFSQFDRGSTSRMKALGNASTAVGGDLSSISSNPAGLGFFNGSEFSFTPEVNLSDVSSTYFGNRNSSTKNQFNLNNAAAVFHSSRRVPRGTDPSKGLLSVNFGLSWNRTNNFYDNLDFSGLNTSSNLDNNSSIADWFAEQANLVGGSIDDLYNYPNPVGYWGYQHYLIDSVGTDSYGNLYNALPQLGTAQQRYVQSTEGGQNEFNLALGLNFSNQLYLGFGAAFTNLRYNSYSNFIESGKIGNDTYETNFRNDQETTGSGFNFKLGMIYKPAPSVQFGASFTSPTWYSIDNHSTLGLQTRFSDGTAIPEEPEPFDDNYNLRTPLKASGGLAVFFNQRGFITADVEYVDYQGMKLSNYESSGDDNRRIKDLYKSTVNARVGAEGRVNDNVYLRAGYSYFQNPEKGIGSATNTISGGIGYRMNNFYVDATYTNVSRTVNVYPYELVNRPSPEATLDKKYNNIYMTVGFRF